MEKSMPRKICSLFAALVAVSLAAGVAPAASARAQDFNGDGRSDLVVGVPFEDLGSKTDAGWVHVLYGSQSGVSVRGNQLWWQDQSDIPGTSAEDEQFGTALAWGALRPGICSGDRWSWGTSTVTASTT